MTSITDSALLPASWESSETWSTSPSSASTTPTTISSSSQKVFTQRPASPVSRKRFSRAVPVEHSFTISSVFVRIKHLKLYAAIIAWRSYEGPRSSELENTSLKGKHYRDLSYSISRFLADFHIDGDVCVMAMILLTRRRCSDQVSRASPISPFQTFQIAVILAKKLLDDDALCTRSWANKMDMDTRQLVRLEWNFCKDIDWKFGVEEYEWIWWKRQLAGTTEPLADLPGVERFFSMPDWKEQGRSGSKSDKEESKSDMKPNKVRSQVARNSQKLASSKKRRQGRAGCTVS